MDVGELCMALMRADIEDEVVALLVAAGYWDDSAAWRLLGDAENNFSSIGNQQSEAIAALVEKLVNSVDARLMNACALTGVDPASVDAPNSIRKAVGMLFEGNDDPDEAAGRIAKWPTAKLTDEGRLLTLAATGNMPREGQPSLTVADQGEGQEPDKWPDTFLSLQKSNKLRIQFVQGKFNMGGTGALQFCGGQHKLQLIVSRRNPALLSGDSSRAGEWGFTIVRREPPSGGARSSTYSYLAPHEVDNGGDGGVLSFATPTWPIFPEANDEIRDAYARHSEYGSLVKMYEYQFSGNKSNIVSSGGGILRRIDSGLPELALPIRLFECRTGYSGHGGSFATNVLGLSARLDRDKADKLEDGFPVGGPLNIGGSTVNVKIFAFKPGEAQGYRTAKQGIIFSLNGQSHATFPIDFFRRKAVGMSYLADSLFVLVDCSAIEGQTREDLFMNSRDRLRDTDLARKLESQLEARLKEDSSLKALRNSRRQADLADRLDDARPLGNILKDLMRQSPALSKLFLQGLQLPSPFPPEGGNSGGSAAEDFSGKTYPTTYAFKGKDDGEAISRSANLESRTRIALETDAEDGYFVRDLDPGACRVLLKQDDGTFVETDSWQVRGPQSGVDYLTITELPSGVVAGDEVTYRLEITDPSRVSAFKNEVTLAVLPPAERSSGGSGQPPKNRNAGTGGSGGGASLALPNIIEVEEVDWIARGMTELSALKILHAGDQGEDGPQVYDFYVNVDNKYLRTAQKETIADPNLLKAQFQYALVLVGLSMLQDPSAFAGPYEDTEADDVETVDVEVPEIERLVANTTRAIAPVILPMIESLGSLSLDDASGE